MQQTPDPAAAPPPRRPWWRCALVVLGGWALLAYPALFALLTMYVGFTGCFIECSRPDAAMGFLGSGALAGLAAAPVLAGFAYRRRSRALWIACGCCAGPIVAIVAWGELSGAT